MWGELPKLGGPCFEPAPPSLQLEEVFDPNLAMLPWSGLSAAVNMIDCREPVGDGLGLVAGDDVGVPRMKTAGCSFSREGQQEPDGDEEVEARRGIDCCC